MSTLSGIASKGDKSKAKFKTIDINNVYKGTSVGPQKTAGKFDYDHNILVDNIPFSAWLYFDKISRNIEAME